MNRYPRKTTSKPPRTPAKGRQESKRHTLQFLILASGLVLLVGTTAAWTVHSNRTHVSTWVKGLLGTKGPSEEPADDGKNEPILYLGGGYANLGDFSVGRYNSITNTTVTVQFRLKGMTACEDKASFEKFMRENKLAFRDRVTEAIRDCRMGDYSDTAAMGKKVAARVNRAFSGRFLESAELADLAIFESVGTYQPQTWQSGASLAAGQAEKAPPEGR